MSCGSLFFFGGEYDHNWETERGACIGEGLGAVLGVCFAIQSLPQQHKLHPADVVSAPFYYSVAFLSGVMAGYVIGASLGKGYEITKNAYSFFHQHLIAPDTNNPGLRANWYSLHE